MTQPDTTLAGRTCLITGATSGIGKATTIALAKLGATIVMVARNQTKGEAVLKEVKQLSRNDSVFLLNADLSSQELVRKLVADFKDRFKRLHMLVNDAGVFLTKYTKTADGIETTFAVNYLSMFLLTNLLLDVLKSSAPSRIVNVASATESGGKINFDDLNGDRKFGGWAAYSNSKLAVIMFTYELARRLEGTGVTVNTLHPGAIRTNLGHGNRGLTSLGFSFVKLFFASPEKGARTVVYLASSPEVEKVSGKYFINCRSTSSSMHSYDEDIRARLWQVSAQLTGLGV